jgi:Mg-chelatase subunit ChlD
MTDSTTKPPTAPASRSGGLTRTSNTTPNGAGGALQKGGSGLKLPGLHARLRNPQSIAGAVDPNKCTNRLALMLDVSGSMDGHKIASLRDAVTGFISACDFSDTSLAMEPFGDDYPSPNRLVLTTLQPMLMTTAMMLQACGSTPMAQALDYVLNTYSITRGVLVSDGEPDSTQACYDSAAQYREAGIMVDCVHIGDSTSGEACLRRIAELTGGQYIKFTDVTSFSKSFKYLTPKYYAMLTSGGVSASDIGAKELK